VAFFGTEINTMTRFSDIVLIIPAYNPPERLVGLVESLIDKGITNLIIINDGSRPDHASIFARIKSKPECHVLTHAVNLGKGRALKTAFNHVLINFPNAALVVTTDADGQHLPEDIMRVTESAMQQPHRCHLGSRTFPPDIPLRSRLGNMLTRNVFGFLLGVRLSDTQTGLRALPVSTLPQLLEVSGERYEYELSMLIHIKHQHVAFTEVPISTVYLDNNTGSHFNPLVDSMKIYFVFARFLSSSLLSAFIDFCVFMAVMSFTESILYSLIASRATASVVNYAVNLKFVFRRQENTLVSILKYYVLLVTIMALAFTIIRLLTDMGLNMVLSKLTAETILFLFSFTLQRDFVFQKDPTDGKN
jgi:glycosyltransferase involved in cell wall biosynthesis